MTRQRTGTHEEWLAARMELLDAEKELTRRGDELAQRRRELPWVAVEKEYAFDTDDGPATLSDLFGGRSQLLVYHFMFGPDFAAGCPSCSAIADGFSGSVVHLQNHDVAFWAVSRAPLAQLQRYKRRMGWTFPWASSSDGEFNRDFHVWHTDREWQSGTVDYNFRACDVGSSDPSPGLIAIASGAGTDPVTFSKERPGMSAFALEDGIVYHTYSAYGRGVDAVWGMYAWLDRAPLGRNEPDVWWRRHDEYGAEPAPTGGT
ncbi:MAG TPA: DUF899 domain-containing protein [Solirubrobacteraceae bacterium]|nr:DUF899 domain-containing protein [Solirubrobacteraceae bacterium]